MLTNDENLTALALTGLMAISLLLAFVSISLWLAPRHPETAPGPLRAARWPRARNLLRPRHAHITGAAWDTAGQGGWSASVIGAVQPMHGERFRYDQLADVVADPQACAEDDTDLDYYDTPSGNLWRLDAQPSTAAAKVL